jgi:alpha-galactosidase
MTLPSPEQRISFVFLATVLFAVTCFASTPEEVKVRDQWMQAHFTENAAKWPVSFRLGDKASADILSSWKTERTERKLDDQRTEITLTATDPETRLVLRCVAVKYGDFPVVEWTPYFKNNGAKDSPILSDIQALDADFRRPAPGDFVLDYAKGSDTAADSYEPRKQIIDGKKPEFRLNNFGGRASYRTWPYWRVSWGEAGAVFALGWPGQWAADFKKSGGNGLRITAGQELTNFKLLPGEEVRAPLIAVLFWKGDRFRAHNQWRRWMVAHNLPRVDGEILEPLLVAQSSHQFNEMLNANEQNQIEMIDRYLEEKLPLRYWWMDAGWYPNDGKWVNTGTWEIDRKRFPNGFRPITDHARAKGVKSILWFEPERVTQNSWLFENHPEWCLAPADLPPSLEYQGEWRLLDLGNDEAREWLVNHVDGMIKKEGIDLYRQDFNMDPLFFWRANDAPDRQGIKEIRHVTGYLDYWDELLRRNPGLRIDSCASGGRRNDLETMRRSLPLLRDDYIFEPSGQQNHTYGLSFWLPFHGTGTRFSNKSGGPNQSVEGGAFAEKTKFDPYLFRSQMVPLLNACWDVRRKDFDYDELRKAVAQFERVSPSFMDDYYPLTPYNSGHDAFMAWQYNSPEDGQGVVQAFRREESPVVSAKFKLHGLDAAAKYEVENLDGGKQTMSGQDLMEKGLEVTMESQPSAAIYAYQRIN